MTRHRAFHSQVPQPIAPSRESIARRVVARTVYDVAQRGVAHDSRCIEAIVRLTNGTSFTSDCTEAIDACGKEVTSSDEIITGPAAMRWVSLIEPLTRLPHDVPTISRWSDILAKSPSVIKRWCAAAGVSAKNSLDFGRLLRVSVQRPGCRADWYNLLDIVDARTLAKLLRRSGTVDITCIPHVATFLTNQYFVSSQVLISAISTHVGCSKNRHTRSGCVVDDDCALTTG